MWKEKGCIGCGAPFTPKSFQQTKCKPDCGRERDYKKKHANSAIKRARELHEVEFIAVDGEGETRRVYYTDYDESTGEEVVKVSDEDRHDYILLSVGDKSLHRDGKNLTHHDIFPFLWECFLENPKAAFVGFALGYDFTMWFRSLTAQSAYKLLTKDGIKSRQPREGSQQKQPWPVRDGGWIVMENGVEVRQPTTWEFDILGSKRFRLRPFVAHDKIPTKIVNHKDGTQSEQKIPRPWMYICDTFPFFQSSFLKAIKPEPGARRVVSDEEYEIITAGKEHRGCGARCSLRRQEECPGSFGPKMIEYNLMENEILARLMGILNEGFVSDEIRLTKKQWMGPGQAAQEWMANIGVPKGEEVREVVPKWALDAGRKCYYGGWFEIFNHGPVPGTSYAYDINSAYPAVIANLPCLLHGVWTKGEGKPGRLPQGSIRMVLGEFSGKDEWLGPLPYRKSDGTILRPRRVKGWYWWHEVQAASKARLLSRMEIQEWIEYAPCKCDPPMRSVRELYNGRLLAGKNTPQGKAKKLVYNSAYGKCAQSIGQPRFSNSVYASLITAGCRAQILSAIATHPTKSASLLMVATDGIVFKEPHPSLDIDGQRLGAWDAETYENLSLFMPGLYWHDKAREQIAEGKAPQLKSRGVSAKYLGSVIDRVDFLWRKYLELPGERDVPRVAINVDWALVGAKQAIVRNAWETCGTNVWNAQRWVDGYPHNKRSHLTLLDAWGGIRSIAYLESDVLETTYYEPRFGQEDEEFDRDDIDELVTQDGLVGEIRAHAFMPR